MSVHRSGATVMNASRTYVGRNNENVREVVRSGGGAYANKQRPRDTEAWTKSRQCNSRLIEFRTFFQTSSYQLHDTYLKGRQNRLSIVVTDFIALLGILALPTIANHQFQ